MKYQLKITFILILFSGLLFNFSNKNCGILKKGTFRYLDTKNSTDYFVIDGKSHKEYLNNGKYWIKSKVKWIGDCEYELELKKIKYPNFPFKKGDKLNVKILGGKGDTIFYKSQIGDYIQKGRLVRIKDTKD